MNKKLKHILNTYSMDLEDYQVIIFIDMEASHIKSALYLECVFCNEGNNLLDETHLTGKSCKCKYLFHAACIDHWFKIGKQECIMCHTFVYRPSQNNKPKINQIYFDDVLIENDEEIFGNDEPVFCHSFALFPEQYQPSGTIGHISRLNNTQLKLNYTDSKSKQMKKLEKQANKHLYNKQQKYVKCKKF